MRKLILFFLGVSLSACETYTSLEDNVPLMFLVADKDFYFQNNAYPKGTKLQYVAVDGGRHAVWVNTSQANAVAGGMGAPVGILSVKNKNGMMLDDDFCSTGEFLANSIGITTIHPWDGYGVRKKISKGVCFMKSAS